MPNGSPQDDIATRRLVGVFLLFIVNILWVLSAELTEFIFFDENFKRPFFTILSKTWLLLIYLIRYLCTKDSQRRVYKVLVEDDSLEMDVLTTVESLGHEGFETMSSESEDDFSTRRRISFASRREIRRLPSSEADEARRARLPYIPSIFDLLPEMSPHLMYTIFFFAPMWLVCAFTYQAAIMFTSVSSLNLISSSSSLFVLVFSICIPSNGSRFTIFKAFLVIINLIGVGIVSNFSGSVTGASLATVSAVAYAIYLTLYAKFMDKYGEIDMNLMFGTIGVLGVIIGVPLLFILDAAGVEKLHPLPNYVQLLSIVASALFGTVVADYLWILAAGMTDSLSASLSLTLSIPLSFIADTVFRHYPPSAVQLLAAIPITISFIGAALADRVPSCFSPSSSSSDSETLLIGDDEDDFSD